MYRTLLPFVCIAFSTIAAEAHEFWIDPVQHQVEPNDRVVADIRVGEEYKGSSYSFIPAQTRRSEYSVNGKVLANPSTIGDRPVFDIPVSEEGLVVLIHTTTDYTITWDEFADFENFVIHKDAAWTLAEHDARGFERGAVTEIYSRYGKSLIAVGGGAGEDRAFGLETEIVALENPYIDDMSDGLDVQVFYQGEVRANEQVEIFEKAPDNTVTISTLKTDSDGRATIPVSPGNRYMLDSVVLREPSPDLAEANNAPWESVWANLTFEVPAN